MLRAQSISSKLQLHFAQSGAQTVLAKRQTGGLAHLGKPYWNGEVLLTQVVNPTAGFFAGDELEVEIALQGGARVLLSQPGATRIHTMRGSESASISQQIRLEGDALLDYYPDLSISQRGSSLMQRTELHLAAQSRCCYLEILTPGRVAHGESLAWNRLTNSLNIFREGRLLARERMHLTPEACWRLLDLQKRPYHLATFWLQHPEVEQWTEPLQALEKELGASLAYTCLAEGFAVLRVLSISSITLRKAVGMIRAALQRFEKGFGQSNALY